MKPEFCIEKCCYKNDFDLDLSFLNPITRRRLSDIDKMTLFLLNECYENNTDTRIVFASRFGEFERLKKLINQYKSDNEVSPNNFGMSVHNSPIGQFSLLNGIKTGYSSIASEEDTFLRGFIQAVLYSKETDVLFCCADFIEGKIEGFCALITAKGGRCSFEIEYSDENECKNPDMKDFYEFIEDKNKNELQTKFFKLLKVYL